VNATHCAAVWGGGNGLRLGMTYCRLLKWSWGGFGALGAERGFCKLYAAGPIFRLIHFVQICTLKLPPFVFLVSSGSLRYGPYAG
jgi:hypothetical protein